MKIDLCIPAYNEGGIIAEAAREVGRVLAALPNTEFRIIVADNGSTDDTALRAAEVAGVSVLKVATRGKGAAVVAAARASSADIFGFIDADLSADPADIPKLLAPLFENSCDISIGSRFVDTALVTREPLRSFFSRLFNALRRAVLGIKVLDTQCGLKLMNAKGRAVLAGCEETGWFFDMEFLARAERVHLRIVELPVHWDEHRFAGRKSKLSLMRDGFGALGGLVRIHHNLPRASLRLVNGSILSNFSYLELSTADEKKYSLHMTPLNRLAMRLIGVPHLGFRMRARIILSQAVKSRPQRVLDAGCGYGLYAMSLGELGYKVDAIDVNPERIRTLQTMADEYQPLEDTLRLQAASLTALPFVADSYDTIICSEVIEHIKDDRAAVSELARVLKQGGTLIISVPYDSRYNKRAYKRFDHERPGYTKESLGKLLRAHGLEVIKDFYYERPAGGVYFNILNALHAKPLIGICFYPLYAMYLLDYYLAFGQPNQMVLVAKKS